MKNRKSIYYLSLALLLSSGTMPVFGYANDKNDAAASVIRSLPKQGDVSLSGTVDKVHRESFKLRDNSGETIDVKAAENVTSTLKAGDKVKVSGTMDDKFLGMGKKINAATVVSAR